jgi:large subunit ribosomal protein L25
MEKPGIRSRIFDLGKFGKALVQSAQFPPVGNTPIHVDFLRVGKRAVVSIPLKIVNARLSPGIKRGGIVNMVFRELRLSVPSDNIPLSISVDLKGKDVGESIDIQSLNIDASLKVVGIDPRTKIVSIVAPSGLSSSSEEIKSEE